jgi:arsenical pump membrane protein
MDAASSASEADVDRRALIEGGAIVAVVLVGFVAGPLVGVSAWMVALAADAVLVVRTRTLPWRAVPIDSAVLVLSLAIITAAALPDGLATLLPTGGLGADAATLGLGVLLANAINNLPALLAGIHGTTAASATGWSWLVGVSLGPVLTPLGSLANLLWWRSAQEQGVVIRAREIVTIGVRVGGPALLAGAATFLTLQAVRG